MCIHVLPHYMVLGMSADWSPSLQNEADTGIGAAFTVLMLGCEVCALISGVSGWEASMHPGSAGIHRHWTFLGFTRTPVLKYC